VCTWTNGIGNDGVAGVKKDRRGGGRWALFGFVRGVCACIIGSYIRGRRRPGSLVDQENPPMPPLILHQPCG